MGAKKKGKKKDDKPKEPQQPIIPDFTPKDLKPLPLSVKVRHFKDLFIIYTDEYSRSLDIKEKLGKIINKQPEDIKLYLKNKRLLEDETTNHDLQVRNCTVIYAVYKTGEGKNDWDNVNEVIKFEWEHKKEEGQEGNENITDTNQNNETNSNNNNNTDSA